jgi:undecaprenyl pyrophosphate phosphatase UppP
MNWFEALIHGLTEFLHVSSSGKVTLMVIPGITRTDATIFTGLSILFG